MFKVAFFSCALTLALLATTLAISPPSSITVIIPVSSRTSGISNGTRLPLGISDRTNDNNTYWGLHRVVNVSVTYPNGTSRGLVALGSLNDRQCRIFPGSKVTSSIKADQNGTYKAQWDITYGISSTPSQIDETSKNCGPEPLSFQNFTLEHTFDVNLNGSANGDVPEATETKMLGSEPTGEVGSEPTSEVGSDPESGSGSQGGGGNGGVRTRVNVMIIPCLALIGGVLLTVV
ncbi:hypothetical protein V5O48_001445 [Marasmius crinis-equi]|uniref:Uncharacterized protein n=1 Tax=Marasmius crinis-equi TaxID=585013 RepID=A0ABR3FYA9_9AGAR